MALDCSVVPSDTPSNPGIAGTGILVSFVATAAIALVLSASTIMHDALHARDARDKRSVSGVGPAFAPATLATMARKLLSSYSDQQIVMGIGLQSLGLGQAHRLVPYHFFLVWLLGLLSTTVHNAALLALVHDVRRDRVVRWLRRGLQLVHLALSCTAAGLLLRSLARGLAPTLPIACAWQGDDAARTHTVAGFSYAATVLAIVFNAGVFAVASWYLRSRHQRWFRAVQMAGFILTATVAIAAGARIVVLSQAFGRPSVQLSDRGETQWSFGQLLSMLLLLLPALLLVEIYRGEIQVAAMVEDEDNDGTDKAKRGPFPLLPVWKKDGDATGSEKRSFPSLPSWKNYDRMKRSPFSSLPFWKSERVAEREESVNTEDENESTEETETKEKKGEKKEEKEKKNEKGEKEKAEKGEKGEKGEKSDKGGKGESEKSAKNEKGTKGGKSAKGAKGK